MTVFTRGFILFIASLAGLAARVEAGPALEDKTEDRPFVYDSQGRRDPFWRLINTRGVVQHYETDLLISDLSLEGIVAEADGSNIAIINGKVLNTGEQVGQFVIKKIGTNYVVLQKGQESYTLKLKKEE
jgi:hypothetical protein